MSESPRSLGQFRQTLITLQETFWIALDTLRSHKLRTFLTLLGVMLAVTTLIAVMSVKFYLAPVVLEAIRGARRSRSRT